MFTLLILTACGNENQIIDTNPPSARVEEAEVTEECAPAEQPVINLTCPEPVVHLSCPEPVVNVQVAAPDVQVDVAAPDVDVTVEGPDMSGIEAAIDDMTLAIEEALASGGSAGGGNFFAGVANCGGTHLAPNILFTNNTNDVAIITSAMQNNEDGGIWIGGVELPQRFTSVKYSHHDANGHSETPSKHGRMTFPLEPGESITCTGSGGKAFYQGYYQ